jgi:hypothetical protein
MNGVKRGYKLIYTFTWSITTTQPTIRNLLMLILPGQISKQILHQTSWKPYKRYIRRTCVNKQTEARAWFSYKAWSSLRKERPKNSLHYGCGHGSSLYSEIFIKLGVSRAACTHIPCFYLQFINPLRTVRMSRWTGLHACFLFPGSWVQIPDRRPEWMFL